MIWNAPICASACRPRCSVTAWHRLHCSWKSPSPRWPSGFALALDDFGTGYSSLAKIVDLPLDVIKIDRSFLRGCPGDARRERVVRSIVMLAHGLKLEVIAEGVETPLQQGFLHALGVQGMQGYLLGRPEPAAHWDRLLASDTMPA
jgi:EAL domain-containing protein (putative c-di-GMP-specific phosphodiesterase class I)